jgi:hypothetical protein
MARARPLSINIDAFIGRYSMNKNYCELENKDIERRFSSWSNLIIRNGEPKFSATQKKGHLDHE